MDDDIIYVDDLFESEFEFCSICEVLGTELTEPFWPEMGLKIKPSIPLRELSRAVVWQHFKNICHSDCERGFPFEELLAEYFQELTGDIGEETAKTFNEWARHIWRRYRDEEWSLNMFWLGILELAEETQIKNTPIFLGIPSEKRTFLKNLSRLRHLKYNNLRRRIEKAEHALEKDTWNPWITYFWNTHTEKHSPFTWVWLQASFRLTMSIWRQVEIILTDDELVQLEIWGKHYGEIMKYPALPIVRNFDYAALGL